MRYVAVNEPNKLAICGSFAECYTRQKGYLPSDMQNTLGKADTWPKSVHSRTKIAIFAEYLRCDTQQRSQNLYIMGQSLGSVRDVTLSKEAMFAECQGLDTRQTRACLSSAQAVRHSANVL